MKKIRDVAKIMTRVNVNDTDRQAIDRFVTVREKIGRGRCLMLQEARLTIISILNAARHVL